MVIDKTYQQWVVLYVMCHGAKHDRNHPSVMSWAKHMEDMLGPNNCKGFIIRTLECGLKGMFLSDGKNMWVPWPREGTLYSWEETAVKITNNPKLEAIRVDHRGVAQDSTGLIVGIIRNIQ